MLLPAKAEISAGYVGQPESPTIGAISVERMNIENRE
jgi:hypothetical protein